MTRKLYGFKIGSLLAVSGESSMKLINEKLEVIK